MSDGDRRAPRQRRARLEPLRVLRRHRRDDQRERLVGREEAVAAGEQVALEPALAVVLAQHLHHAAVGRRRGRRSAIVRSTQAAVLDLEDRAEPVRVGLVGAEEAEVRRRVARDRCRAAARPSWRVDSRCSRPGLSARRPRSRSKSGSSSGTQQACRRWRAGSRPSAARPRGASAAQLGDAGARARRRAPRAGSSASSSSMRECAGFVAHLGERHLVRAERALDRHAVDHLRAGPSLRRAQHDRGPARPRADPPRSRASRWIVADRVEARVERRRERLVHRAADRRPRRSAAS